jgi:hypothetical protein
MRQRFMQMLENDDGDDATDAIVQRFWSRASPLATRNAEDTDAQVVDLAQWARSRGHTRRA